MLKNLTRAVVAAVFVVTAAWGLAACGGGEPDPPAESEAFVSDMTEGVRLINEQIAQGSLMTNVMLASDVDRPTQKYGMWVLPYHPSDAVEKFTMKIEIKDGTDFHVTAVSAETGKTWRMDQAGVMTEDAGA
ncbi:MAG: hypothetical protein LBS56_09845 [Propionibacteriaceae bacterium]|jgi:hypothetical protein|nr:hypothetical protein [Propionibacteriaceae bacterium]